MAGDNGTLPLFDLPGSGAGIVQQLVYARWARLPYEILILGETGTGKTILARLLHELSGRPGPCVTCSLAELPDELAMSELFGHIRGAFTGAHTARAGVFEAALRGTVILEEVGKASLRVQGALLRVVEEKKVVRLGEQRERPVDVRLIAVSNRDLDAMVAAGAFLDDLRARFGFYVLRMTPLRDQPDRIMEYAAAFLEAEILVVRRERAPVLEGAVTELLRSAPWRRNIRELRDVCRYLVGNAGETAAVRDLPAEFLRTVGIDPSATEEPIEMRVRRVLAEERGNKARTARRLRISRSTLYRTLDAGP